MVIDTSKLTSILTEMAEYVQGTHEVEADRMFGTVAIKDSGTQETEIFLQGHEADEFFEQMDVYWNEAMDICPYIAACATAKPYVDCL